MRQNEEEIGDDGRVATSVYQFASCIIPVADQRIRRRAKIFLHPG